MIHTVLRRSLSSALLAATVVLIPARAGLAELPAIYDRIPAEATAVLSTKSVNDLDRAVSQLLGAMEMPALATPSEMLRRVGLAEGVDLTRPLALALMPGDLEAEAPPALLFLPTTDFNVLMRALGADPDGQADAITSFVIQTGETLYARAAEGGYAIIGIVRDLVAGADGKRGHLKAHEANLGAAGARLVESSHIASLIKKPLLELLNQRVREEAARNLDKADVFGDMNEEDFQAQAEKVQRTIDAAFTDATDMVVGLQAGSLGLTLDTLVDFTPGSEHGRLFTHPGNSAGYLTALPNQPFLLSMAFDLSAPSIKRFFDAFPTLGRADGEHGPAAAELTKLLGMTQGVAGAIYTSPGGILGGLLANTIGFAASDNPAAMMQATRDFITKRAASNGPVAGNVKKNATTVDGVAVDEWSVSVDPTAIPGGAAPQAMAMAFGPTGMGGYTAPGKTGIYQTYSRNSMLLSAGFAAEKGQNSLSADRMVSMVSKRLPEGRSAEVYIGVHDILQQALQFAAMFGMPLNIDIPPQLPPVGMGVTTVDSAARLSTYIPTPVLKSAIQISQQVQRIIGGDNGAANNKRNNNPPF